MILTGHWILWLIAKGLVGLFLSVLVLAILYREAKEAASLKSHHFDDVD